MSIITLFSGVFCNEAAVAQDIMESTGYRLITNEMVTARAQTLSGMDKDKIKRAFTARTSVFNPFTHEKEQAIAYLKLALANMLKNKCIVTGYSGLLLPQTITHVLRVCLIAKTKFRLSIAQTQNGVSKEAACDCILAEDLDRTAWTTTLFSQKDPWAPSLYDMVLPMGKTVPPKAAALIEENLLKKVVRQTQDSKSAMDDFLLAAQTEVNLVNAGHNVGVDAHNGIVELTINKKVLMLSRLEQELKSIAGTIPGVESVHTHVRESDLLNAVYQKRPMDIPPKVLLVDDERDFVQTLSERLQIRDIGSAVAYDGESALDLVHNDDPEVMIIDLKMPGIDGMQVLEQVKLNRPEIEVIVLTGHGSEQDREKCMNMGAFAYMQKPVDINQLSTTLNQAHEKIKRASAV
ncbi:MAG: response regulator [Desulfobacter sp.]|nr:response regulator [Desulfobacter sp.]